MLIRNVLSRYFFSWYPLFGSGFSRYKISRSNKCLATALASSFANACFCCAGLSDIIWLSQIFQRSLDFFTPTLTLQISLWLLLTLWWVKVSLCSALNHPLFSFFPCESIEQGLPCANFVFN